MATLSSELTLGCQCGKVTGAIKCTPQGSINHISCYCKDCQAFARHLNAEAITLDEHRGTAIIQTSPATVNISSGTEHLNCLKLSPKGITRWYAGCCNTPIANTMSNGKMPFSGVIRSFVKTDNVEQIAGPVEYKVFASLSPEANGHNKAPLGLIAKIVVNMLRWKLRGDHKNSPFFSGETGKPVREPKILSLQERNAASRS